ncbi:MULTISPECIES: outer membrane protein assembly factor BamD [unclassified Sphingomonas]|jgi:outer membrane protein assembly factor BamD|uniref:outer membrane protein assembly factor BamD n=1 Tax=unclassified Sphingomonas TaxID=196159 RepID=UPI00226A032B|nr:MULTISPECIES: outer membrane protein assembly factor BamD [unclassified Sphingomonas]
MRIPQSKALSLALIAAVAFPIAGCARNRAKGDTPYVARDVGTLYSTARRRLDQGRYKEAAILFDEVERQHPYSVWARRAQLMSAFSYYLGNDYTQSIQSAQRFLSVHPGNRDAPYAYYLVALSYYEQIKDVTRDQKITRQALDALGELTRRYPNTRYASDARLKIDLVNDHLAGKEMEIGRFYETRGQWLAASMRFRTVIDQYQQTTHTPEALMRLTETYLELGVPQEAQRATAVLGHNYPGTDWYAHAYKLMQEHPPKAVAALAPGQEAVPRGTPGSLGTQGNALPGSSGTATPTAEAPGAPTPASPSGGAGSTAPITPAGTTPTT